jgi:hypothetical protein
MNNLFEYQNKINFNGNYSGLEEFLDEIWNKREQFSYYETEDSHKIEVQRFIQFIHKTNELKSNKYVGVIHFEGQRINLLPKIFYDPEQIYGYKEINAIHQHILWYLSYCRKLKFPSFKGVFKILCHGSAFKVCRRRSGSVSQSLRMGTTKTARRKGLGYASAVPTPGALRPV